MVEGTLKTGADHVYSRRTSYIDEDSWQDADPREFSPDALNYYIR